MNLNSSVESYFNKIGTFGFFIFLFFVWLGNAVAYAGLALMCITFLVQFRRHWETIKYDRPTMVVFAFAVYILIRTVWSIIEFPELKSSHLNSAQEWLFLGLFIPVSCYFRRYRGRASLTLVVLFTGFALSVARLTDWQACGFPNITHRCGFGFQIILGALLLSTSFLGLLIFVPQFVGKRWFHWTWLLRAAIWEMLVAIISYFIILTGTRTVWIGLSIILPAALLIRYKEVYLAASKRQKKIGTIIGVLFVLTLMSVLVANQSIVKHRFEQSLNDVVYISSQWKNGEVQAGGSIGERVSMFMKGYYLWLERPLFGWGVAGINHEIIIGKINKSKGYMTHLNNTYLEILVRFGVIGGLLFLALVFFLFYGLYVNYRRNEIRRDLLIFTSSALMLLLVWCIADFQLTSLDWRFFCIIIIGLAHSLSIYNRA